MCQYAPSVLPFGLGSLFLEQSVWFSADIFINLSSYALVSNNTFMKIQQADLFRTAMASALNISSDTIEVLLINATVSNISVSRRSNNPQTLQNSSTPYSTNISKFKTHTNITYQISVANLQPRQMHLIHSHIDIVVNGPSLIGYLNTASQKLDIPYSFQSLYLTQASIPTFAVPMKEAYYRGLMLSVTEDIAAFRLVANWTLLNINMTMFGNNAWRGNRAYVENRDGNNIGQRYYPDTSGVVCQLLFRPALSPLTLALLQETITLDSGELALLNPYPLQLPPRISMLYNAIAPWQVVAQGDTGFAYVYACAANACLPTCLCPTFQYEFKVVTQYLEVTYESPILLSSLSSFLHPPMNVSAQTNASCIFASWLHPSEAIMVPALASGTM